MAGKQIGPMLLAFAIALVCGLFASFAGLPLPWMLGPMIGTTIAALAHLPIKGPARIRGLVIPIIGVFLGSGFNPALFSQIGEWVVTLAILPPFIAVSTLTGFMILRKLGGYDRVTAFFAAVPGGLNDMMMIGEENGGDGRRIALAHGIRIFVVITCVAMFFGIFLGVTSQETARHYTTFAELAPKDAVLLFLCAAIGAVIARMLRLPAGPLLGPMVLSAVLHLTQIVVVEPPTLLVILAQLTIGTVIGCRFAGTALSEVGRDIALAVLCSVALLGVALVFALLIHTLTGTDMSQAFLAYSPGGLTEMSLLAFAMGQEIAYVSVAHVARIVFVIFGTPIAFRLLGWRKPRSGAPP